MHAFEEAMLDHFKTSKSDLRDKLVESKSFKGLEDEFLTAMQEFKAGWQG